MGQDPYTTTQRSSAGARRAANTRQSSGRHNAALLVVLVGPDTGRRVVVGDGVIVGRDVDGRGLILDEGVSRRHMRVSRQADGTHLVEDLGSRNGTYVNGQRVEAAPLQSGDKIAVGSGTILLFTRNDRYEEQVVRAQKMQALGQLAGGVAHDFNNLVLAILGNVDYLKARDGSPDDVDECLSEIETAARRAAQLTRQLLSFTRKRDAVLEPVDVPALVDEAAALLRRTLPRTVDIRCEIDVDLSVMGDSALLLQVLLNAGINAGQAMPGGGQLIIRAQQSAMHSDPLPVGLGPGRYLRIDLEDNGLGMDVETAERAFQPFFSTKPEGEGTGLGLSTAQSVVRDHGGEITIDSEVDQGTCVSVYLPTVRPSRPVPAATEASLTQLAGSVLVIDEEGLVRSTARRLLRRFGLDVEVAADADEATEIVESSTTMPNVVLVGDNLPGTSIESVVPLLRQLVPDAQILVSSSRVEPEHTTALERMGVLSVLRKPWGARKLWSKVWLALNRARD